MLTSAKTIAHRLDGPLINLGGGLLGVMLGLLLILGGCSSSTEPEGGGDDPVVSFQFTPTGQGQSLRLSETMDFSVAVQPAQSMTARWYLNRQEAGQDPAYTFVPGSVGKDTLGLSVFAGAVQDTYHWVITVEEDVSVIPPEVPGVLAEPGSAPADVKVSWKWVTNATYPLVEYQVAVSYDGAINEENWDQATILGRYDPVPGQVGYIEEFTEAEDGMRPGEQAWFAVRVMDDRQQLSDLTESSLTDITWPWHLDGFVTDDSGLPMLGVILSVDGISLGNTDGSGYFKLTKAFRNIDSIRVKAEPISGGFNFTTEPISVAGEVTRQNIVLISDYELDIECTYPDFLSYLRGMSRNVTVPGDPELSRFYTWEEYPVSVYIPDQLSLGGIDMKAACVAALDFWNSQMRFDADNLGITETDYFVPAGDETGADIVFLFENRVQNYGEVTLLLPGPDEELGEVFPEKMEIWINTTAVLDSLAIAGVALHEFGHSLGMFSHSECATASDHLMLQAGGVPAFHRAVPIHLDERRGIRAFRNLPKGVNMEDFDTGKFQ